MQDFILVYFIATALFSMIFGYLVCNILRTIRIGEIRHYERERIFWEVPKFFSKVYKPAELEKLLDKFNAFKRYMDKKFPTGGAR